MLIDIIFGLLFVLVFFALYDLRERYKRATKIVSLVSPLLSEIGGVLSNIEENHKNVLNAFAALERDMNEIKKGNITVHVPVKTRRKNGV